MTEPMYAFKDDIEQFSETIRVLLDIATLCDVEGDSIRAEKLREVHQEAAVLAKDFREYRDDSKLHHGPYGPVCARTGQLDAGLCYKCQLEDVKRERAEMQLVAGRFQYLHQEAQKAINAVDDQFEYAHKTMTPEQLQEFVHGTLAKYTEAVSKTITKNRK